MRRIVVSSDGFGYGFLVDDDGRLRPAGFGSSIEAHMEGLSEEIGVSLYPLAYDVDVGATLAGDQSCRLAWRRAAPSALLPILLARPGRPAPRSRRSRCGPDQIWSWSDEGTGPLSRRLHGWVRRHAVRDGGEQRPIVVNNWEATGFSFDTDRILTLIDQAADLGAELFLLDDG